MYVLLWFVLSFGVALAQTTNVLSLSVTPTLFEMSANPGQVWQSSVKVINSNSFDIVVYPSVVNFEPQGEAGQGKLIPVLEEMTEGSTLAEWVEIAAEPITIAREESLSIPFTVRVPEDAVPGGHFAAILISTQPPIEDREKLSVRTSQVVSSLFFVRVAGDVIEEGSIRSFSVTNTFVQEPEATFELRFENKGNVHLQPRGEIAIYNMWGKERGKIPINHRTHFGNVLPDSIRAFNFTWSGEQSITDIGRYKAIVSLGYGVGSTKFSSATAYFWVIPVKSTLITIGGFLLIIFLISRAIKLYVRHMLAMAGVRPETGRYRSRLEVEHDLEVDRYETLTGPVRNSFAEIKARLAGATALVDVLKVLGSSVFRYKVFFGFMILFVVIVFAVIYFIGDITRDKDFAVSIDNPDTSTNLNAEEVAFTELTGSYVGDVVPEAINQPFALTVTNTSGRSGAAASVAAKLREQNFAVSKLSADQDRINKNTVIVYDPALSEAALELSGKLGGALLSARTSTSTAGLPNITVFVGQDQPLQ